VNLSHTERDKSAQLHFFAPLQIFSAFLDNIAELLDLAMVRP